MPWGRLGLDAGARDGALGQRPGGVGGRRKRRIAGRSASSRRSVGHHDVAGLGRGGARSSSVSHRRGGARIGSAGGRLGSARSAIATSRGRRGGGAIRGPVGGAGAVSSKRGIGVTGV